MKKEMKKTDSNTEKAQSQIMATVVLILMILAAVIIFWNVFNFIIEEKTKDIRMGEFSFGADIDYFNVNDLNLIAKIKIKRDAGGEDISGIKFIFEDDFGQTYIYEDNVNYPDELETRYYLITNPLTDLGINDFSNIKDVSLVFLYGEKGEQITRILDSEEKVESREIDEKAYYVDIDSIGGICSDDNSGTINQPWCTVLKGFSSAMPGNTIYFREGVYRQEKIIMGNSFSHYADENNRIIFKGYPGEEAVITSMKLKNNINQWTLEYGNIYSTDLVPQQLGEDNVKVERIPHASQDRIPLILMTENNQNGGPQDITGEGQWVRDISEWKLYIWARGGGNPGNYLTEIAEFPHGGSSTIFLNGKRDNLLDDDEADYLTFENLVIEGGYYPIEIGTDHIEIINCTIRNCYGDGIKVGGEVGKQLDDPTYYNSEYGLIKNTEIYNFGESGIDITGGDYWTIKNTNIHNSVPTRGDLPQYNYYKTNGIMLKNNDINNIVENNVIYDMHTTFGAITIGGASKYATVQAEAINNVIRNNIIYNTNGRYAILFQAAHNCSFVNNIIYGGDYSQSIILFQSEIKEGGTVNNVNNILKNNIIYLNDVLENMILMQYNYGAIENLDTDYNIIPPESIYYLDDGQNNLNQIRAKGYEINSITDYPVFNDEENKDFRLSENSPGIDEGIVVGEFHCLESDDINFNQKDCMHWNGVAPDIGAFEYSN